MVRRGPRLRGHPGDRRLERRPEDLVHRVRHRLRRRLPRRSDALGVQRPGPVDVRGPRLEAVAERGPRPAGAGAGQRVRRPLQGVGRRARSVHRSGPDADRHAGGAAALLRGDLVERAAACRARRDVQQRGDQQARPSGAGHVHLPGGGGSHRLRGVSLRRGVHGQRCTRLHLRAADLRAAVQPPYPGPADRPAHDRRDSVLPGRAAAARPAGHHRPPRRRPGDAVRRLALLLRRTDERAEHRRPVGPREHRRRQCRDRARQHPQRYAGDAVSAAESRPHECPSRRRHDQFPVGSGQRE